MNSTSISPWFWSSDTALWNYGDAISVFLVDELIYDFFPYSARTHIIGSVIFDGILQDSDPHDAGLEKSLYEDRDIKAVFWGCGIRNPGSLSSDLYSSVEFLAVRGPVSASDLRLGGTVPQGDPALLLPALYKPRRSPKFVDKSVCVPHYNDSRTDEEIRRISGCDLVLRPAVKKDRASIKAFIDAICSARFILAGAMHAAVTAAAYGVPFGFWDSGAIDIPTKWEDMASLLGISCAFFETVDEAAEFYEREIAPTIAIPSLWPLICVAPGFLKTAGMLKVLKYEMERSTGKPFEDIDYFIEEMVVRSAHHDRIALLAHEMNDDFLKRNAGLSDNLSSAVAALEARDAELFSVQGAYDGALAVQQQQSDVMATMAQDKAALQQQLAIQTELLERALADRQAAVQAQEQASGTIDRLTGQVDALTATLKDRDDALDRLTGEMAQKDNDLDAQAAQATRMVDDLRADHDRQMLAERQDAAQLRDAFSLSLREAQAALADATTNATQERERLLADQAALEREVAAAKDRLTQVEAAAATERDAAQAALADAMTNATQERERFETERAALEQQFAAVEEKLAQGRTQAARDQAAVEHRLAGAAAAAQEERQRFDAERAALVRQIGAVEFRLEQARAQAASEQDGFREALLGLEQEKARFAAQKDALEQHAHAVQARLDAANNQVRHHRNLQDASEQRVVALMADNAQLKAVSAELGLERNQLKRLAAEHGLMIDAFRAEVATLSDGLDEQRRQSDRRVQNLAMEHEEQMLAQQESYRALETDMGRLQEEMVRLIDEASQRTMQTNARFDAIRQSLQQDIARLTDEKDAASARNVTLEQDIDALRGQVHAADAEAQQRRQQIDQLHAEIQHVRAQADSLRDQSQTLVAQHVALRADMALTESESAAKTARADAALSRYWQLLGQSSAQLKGPGMLVKLSKMNKKSKIMREHREIISAFLDKFSETELNFSKSGRKQRITQYLMGVTPDVEDFPIFNRDIYLYLNPDVAEAGIEPFVHFIQNGQWEARVIHPVMDIPYYVTRYPEADKFKISAVEHYFKFGVGKNYDPSPLFSTQWYFDHYTDVKMLGINPVIHYLRYPGCQPHPDFESDHYRKQNLDVVRHGINPLAHYALWGRHEGRRPTAYAPPVIAAEIPAPIPEPEPAPVPVALVAAPAPTPEPAAPVAVQAHVPPPIPVGNRPIVVMMDAFYPRPDEDSGSLDQVNFIRIFQNLGYDVAFIALLNFGDGPEVGAKVAALGAHCITASEFASVEEYLFLNQERIAILFLSRVHFGGAWIDRARAFCPKARILFNTVDLHHIREEREAALRGDADSIARAQETKRLEYGCIMAADASIVVSEHEQTLLAGELPSARVAVVPLMREIPRTSFPDWQGRQHLAFVGGFQHQPNIDAVNYFLDEIWPVVQARRPELIFHVIGSHLPDTLKERHAPNVEWVGYVPEIEPWLDRLRLTVAPLRYGAGAKGKVVSSLLNGVPCVATAVAAEGMGLRIGQDIVSCHNPQEFAEAIIRVHDDADMWNSLSAQGFETISRTYSIEYAQNCLKSVI